MKINNNNLSFGARYNFFQNQRDFLCASCGKRMIPEIEIKEISKMLETLKGRQISNSLSPYLELMQEKSKPPLAYLLEQANKEQFQNWSFRNLSMLFPEKEYFQSTNFETLKKLLNDIHFSVEHIIARINGGKNEQINYLPMHLGCNMDRSADSYSNLASKNPDFLLNLRNSLLVLKIKNGLKQIALPENYFSEVKVRLKQEGLDITSLSDI